MHDRRRLRYPGFEAPGPGQPQFVHVAPVDLLERAVPPSIEGAPPAQPVGRVGILQHRVGDEGRVPNLRLAGRPRRQRDTGVYAHCKQGATAHVRMSLAVRGGTPRRTASGEAPRVANRSSPCPGPRALSDRVLLTGRIKQEHYHVDTHKPVYLEHSGRRCHPARHERQRSGAAGRPGRRVAVLRRRFGQHQVLAARSDQPRQRRRPADRVAVADGQLRPPASTSTTRRLP